MKFFFALLITIAFAEQHLHHGGFGSGETDPMRLATMWKPTEEMKEVTNENYSDLVVNSDKPWLLLFKKETDFMSQKARDIYYNLAKKHTDINFGFVDIFKNERLKMTYSVSTIPRTFFI